MKTKLFIHLVFIGTFVIITGCSSGNKVSKGKIINSDVELSIITGSGGGFTGSYEGNFIDTLGQAYKWHGKTFELAEKTSIGQLTEEQLDELTKYIYDNDILKTNFKEHGNITTFISLNNSLVKHSISWNGLEPDNKVPENLKKFYTRLKQIIMSLQKK